MTILDNEEQLEHLRKLMDKIETVACTAHQYNLELRQARHELTRFVEALEKEAVERVIRHQYRNQDQETL